MLFLRRTLYPFRFLVKARKMSTKPVSEPLVLTDRLGHVCLIGLNRPQKRNCVNPETAAQLVKAVEDFEADEELRVAILYGKGGNFCAGYDLEALSQMDSMAALPDAESIESGNGPMGPTRRFIKKPMIAAVEGYAVAGGLELALMCDIRIVEESTIMGVFCRRFGVPLLDGGTVRLSQLIGHSRALDMIIRGVGYSGKECFEMGLANHLTKTGAAIGLAMNMAQSICNYPQECLNRDRLSAYNSCFNARSLDEAFKFEWDNAKHVVQQESIKGASSFVKGAGKKGNFDAFNSKL